MTTDRQLRERRTGTDAGSGTLTDWLEQDIAYCDEVGDDEESKYLRFIRDEHDSAIARAVEVERERCAHWHDEKARAARERERYFADGPGFMTHCCGAAGADAAAKRYGQQAHFHETSAEALRASDPTPAEQEGDNG